MTESDRQLLRSQRLTRFSETLGHTFADMHLLDRALCHRSYRYETLGVNHDNERMEFLGDTVLNFLISELLFQRFPKLDEGQLSKLKAYFTSSTYLARQARLLGVGDYLLLGRGEEASGGRQKSSLLENALEAIIAALYLDGGMAAAADFIHTHMSREITLLGGKNIIFDYKTALQEYTQKTMKVLPNYVVNKVEGPEHQPLYSVSITLGNDTFGPETATTIKEAQKKLARKVLTHLMKQPSDKS